VLRFSRCADISRDGDSIVQVPEDFGCFSNLLSEVEVCCVRVLALLTVLNALLIVLA
jgi:hypothetical protein